MTRTTLKTATALALLLAAAPATAQDAGGRLTVREAPAQEAVAVQGDLQARLSAEASQMASHVAAIRDGQRALARCTGEAATARTPQDGAMSPVADGVGTLMDCFVDQAVINERVLSDWSASMEVVEVILLDGAAEYARLAEGKAAEIAALRETAAGLDENRAELRRRLARVRAFLDANGRRLEGETQHEAMRLRMEWDQIDRRTAHLVEMERMTRRTQGAFENASTTLSNSARKADLQALDFAYRAEREVFYVELVSEATVQEVALEQVAGMQADVARMASNMDAARVALEAAADERPDPVPAPPLAGEVSLLGGMDAADDLEAWIRNFDETDEPAGGATR